MSKYTYTIGRRKTASAQVRVYPGKGKSMINGKPASDYITRKDLFETVYAPLRLCKQKEECYFEVQVMGSGEKGQAEAIRLGLARALAEKSEEHKVLLKEAGFLTRDARKVERKKPGLHKARKAIQWSKR